MDDFETIARWIVNIGAVIGAIYVGGKFMFDRGRGFAEINAQIEANTEAILALSEQYKADRIAIEEQEKRDQEWRDQLAKRQDAIEGELLAHSQAIERVEGNVVRLLPHHER